MSLLILHRGSLRANRYAEWLADFGGDVVLLASQEKLDAVKEELRPTADGFLHAEAITGYDLSGRLESRALELAEKYDVQHVFASNEYDLERAALLREILRIPGQGSDSAQAFRDKVLMKEAALAGGVPVAPYRTVECAADVHAFAADHGFPLVVKPRNAAGSVGTTVVRTPEELDELVALRMTADQGRPNLLVEAFVPGGMCHVDGLVLDGEVVLAWPSRYLDALVSFPVGGILADVSLDPDDPLAARLLALCDRLMSAMPTPPNCAFHIEVFHTPDDRLVLCEVASRTGGAKIKETIEVMFGVDLTEAWLRAEVGLEPPRALRGPRRPRPRTMAGSLLMLSRPGLVRDVPRTADFPWAERYELLVEPGQRLDPAAFCGDVIASLVVSAPDRRECERRLGLARRWFEDAAVIDPPPHA
ncbi:MULTISPECIES: ATP-grasp domain-containing protein [Streptomyces]|uniref:ATP-grasp domain-containing protein n=1 Tax=Streptomyces sudanensis TaxID=436397 RepID=A0ABY4TJ77_9ACTN|nr:MULTISPECIES: ATP-grasp domain-containing protein [Streptomyces]URN18230.1 ATP-grasp domain-containing protein [Streptomyces sudanensis]